MASTCLFASMTGIFTLALASNQSADIFFFLPKMEMAVLCTASLRCCHLSLALLFNLPGRTSSSARANSFTLSWSRVLLVSIRGLPAFLFAVMQCPWQQLDLTADQRVICITVSTLVAARELDTRQRWASVQNQI